MRRKEYQGQLTTKDMSVLREGASAKDQSKMNRATVRDYGMQHRVTLRWDLNEDAIQDKIFIMQIDDYEVILDAEEMQRYLRWM